MAGRKIFNHKSIVLRDRTFEKFGYYPEKWGESSNKFIVAICRYCGEEVDIRKGFFNKAGSACHKACKIEEMRQQKSPFSDPEVRKKSQKVMDEKYGTDRKEIREKISKKKLSKETKEKFESTCMEKYGVKNPFQSEEIKDKIKQTSLEKYGTEHHMQNEEIKNKTKETYIERYGVDNPLKNEEIKNKVIETNIERYGCPNPMQNEEVRKKANETNLKRYGVDVPLKSPDILEKMKETNIEKYGFPMASQNSEIYNKIKDKFNKSVLEDKNKNFTLINTLRLNEKFWEDMKNMTISQLSEKYNIDYSTLTAAFSRNEFKERYNETYSYPKFQIQKSIYDLISSYGFKTEFNTRKIITPYELDIYIPEKKFAIEFNGSYWHSEAVLEEGKAYRHHRNKLDMCREEGIYLFNIFEHQWRDREKQILNFIKTILGINNKKIAGRKCNINNEEQKDFMNDNHIQGYGQGTKKWFNLEYEGEIIASMTASKHHRQNGKKNYIVLNRLCFKDGVNVQGGSSKLFKAFKKWAREENYEGIISWSDNCWTEGKIYGVLGFELEKEYTPDYFYWDRKNDCYRSKQSQTKKINGCPEGITERDWNYSLGLYRIYDCGKKRWMYKL